MKKILLIMGACFAFGALPAMAATDKFEILPDLPEPLASAQASSISTVSPDSANVVAQSVGAEPNFLSVVFSLIFVILLIYATGIIYTKLNKVGLKALKKQAGELDASKVSVISTTPLGNNKTLHVVELDGKRMLLGASTNGINLLKDLGACSHIDIEDGEFSKIEIPNIRIPKIEIPKIEFPNIGFTRTSKKESSEETDKNSQNKTKEEKEDFEFSEIYEESPDGIIDRLFTPSEDEKIQTEHNEKSEHEIDPDAYALYKKYL